MKQIHKNVSNQPGRISRQTFHAPAGTRTHSNYKPLVGPHEV